LGSKLRCSKGLRALFNIEDDSKPFDNPKPELLLNNVFERSSNESDLVLGFFSGSSTTMVVIHKMKRHYIGVE